MMTKMSDYNIHYSSNELFSFSEKIKTIYQGKKLFIITDDAVFKLYEKTISKVFFDFEIQYIIANKKSFSEYEKLTNDLLKLSIKKDDMIVALGGGTIGDLAGFVASTVLRGVDYIQIPTTLLSQIDSSVGGKTAIDTNYGKNLVGSFYNPKLVLIDDEFLRTLSQREYNNGLAEAIKMSLLFDKDLFNKIKMNETLTLNDIKVIVEHKKKLVELDPFDFHERRVLNFGHTFGHAIEKTNNYQKYKHGEAISYGMLIALKIGILRNQTNPDLYNELEVLLKNKGLVTKPFDDYQRYIPEIKIDKKGTSKGIDFIILEDIEKPKIINIGWEEL